jgi:hypothetical protein
MAHPEFVFLRGCAEPVPNILLDTETPDDSYNKFPHCFLLISLFLQVARFFIFALKPGEELAVLIPKGCFYISMFPPFRPVLVHAQSKYLIETWVAPIGCKRKGKLISQLTSVPAGKPRL